ncbi:uncharacterized protein LOC122399889 [Colletes gigas]|uniref:uncharacterized protein LOC122399889 n=1 Tax=Colletes gigas TaxID=935657 RepID=UPI001C9BABF0|nr:uncharacterized protein LOC122399889 [Colletes gigas]
MKAMNAATVLLILATGLASGQLNFEGNPLTEDTEYTAEESRISSKASTETFPKLENATNASRELENEVTARPEAVQTARHLPTSPYVYGTNSINTAELALSTFLNSKTPEESRLSLDSYLQTRKTPQNVIVGEQTASVAGQQLPQQVTPPQMVVSSPVNQHLTAQLMQQRQMMQAYPVNRPQFGEQVYNAPTSSSSALNAVGTALPQQVQAPYMQPGIQSRNDLFYPAGWHNRVRRIRGRPFLYAQSRGGPGGFYNGPPGPYKPKGPIEVIYTKPPGFGRGPPGISNPPVPYEDASAWFPEADHPPPPKDVYYSQLYAQSYDPYYYNYIAKTGKVKPHLYGKLGKYHEEEGGDGIWAELYRGFKKHGLKNMMTPTFLLGMTLPVVTLMLTALVQKRSFARSDSRQFSQEETVQEYLEQLQRAVECYEKKRRKRDANVNECWTHD